MSIPVQPTAKERERAREIVEPFAYAFPIARVRRRFYARIAVALAQARAEERERCARIVDQCNRDGPYNAVIAGRLIRASDDGSDADYDPSRGA